MIDRSAVAVRKVDKIKKAKFQVGYLEMALRRNKNFRIVDLTESLLVLKENRSVTGPHYYGVILLTGFFIWSLTTAEVIPIASTGIMWVMYTLGFVFYRKAVRRQIFIVDLNKSVILSRTGVFDKLKKHGPLQELVVSAEIDQFRSQDADDYFRITFYMQNPDQSRGIVLKMDSPFVRDCDKFQKAMCRYFKNVCHIQHIRMKRLGKELSLKDLN